MCIRDRIFSNSQITEFNYRLSDPNDAHVLVGIKTKSVKNFISLKNRLSKNHYPFKDLTKNEISNDHLRHMVGGRSFFHQPYVADGHLKSHFL